MFQKALLEMKPLQCAAGMSGLLCTALLGELCSWHQGTSTECLRLPQMTAKTFLVFFCSFCSAWHTVLCDSPAAWWAEEVPVSVRWVQPLAVALLWPSTSCRGCLWCHAHLCSLRGHWSEDLCQLQQGFLQEGVSCSWRQMPCAWAQTSQCTDG